MVGTRPDQAAEAAAASEVDAPAGAPNEPPAMALAEIPIPVEDAPPLVPLAGDGAPGPGDAAAVPEDIESVAIRRRARGQARQRRDRQRFRMPALILVLVALCAALLGWRKDVVRHVPQLASLYAAIGMPVNLRGLAFIDLKIGNEIARRRAGSGGRGRDREHGVDAGRSPAAAVCAAQRRRRRSLFLDRAAVAADRCRRSKHCRSAAGLPRRPRDAHDVQVRFFTHRDAVAGLH